jgi:hypothetical protein
MSRLGGVSLHHMLHIHPCIKRQSKQPMELISLSKVSKGSAQCCTPSITLSSVLYAPSFPVSLVSLSSLVDDIDCRVIVDRYNCIIEKRTTGRRLGVSVRH